MLGWDRNPLRRRIDRVEAAVVAGLIAVFLISAPMLGAAAGHWSDSAAMREQRAEMAWRLVPATVQGDAQRQIFWADGDGLDDGTLDGAGRAGAPRLDFGHPGKRCRRQRPGVGHPVGLADLATAPALAGEAHIVLAEWLAVLVLGLLLCLAAGAGRVLFARRRLADWNRAWRAVEPRWTRQR